MSQHSVHWFYSAAPIHCTVSPRIYRLILTVSGQPTGKVVGEGHCVESIKLSDCYDRWNTITPLIRQEGRLGQPRKFRFCARHILSLCHPCQQVYHREQGDPPVRDCKFENGIGGNWSWMSKVDLIKWYPPSEFYTIPLTSYSDGTIQDTQYYWEDSVRKL